MSLRDHRMLWTVVLLCFLCCLRTDRTNRDLLFLQNQIVARSLKPPEETKLFEYAATGMVAALDDPYAAYIPESQSQEFNEMIDSTMRGIGIEMRIEPATQQPIIISPVDGSPAQLAGLRAGDRIVSVDGQETTGRTLKVVHDWIQGEIQSEVQLRLADPTGTLRNVSVVRDAFPIPTVLGDTRLPDGRWNFRLREDPSIGYFRITSFGQLTAAELEIAILSLLHPQEQELSESLESLKLRTLLGESEPSEEGPSIPTPTTPITRMILDLRGNPGGLLEQGIQTCDLFLDHGVIVTARGRDQRIEDIREATPGRTIHTKSEFPMVVLIDADTASAAEIVAACLADHGRATIVGDRSYGKGTIQQTVPMPRDRGILKLTTGSYWRPSERNIHRFPDATDADDWGVSPDPEHRVKPNMETEVRRLIWRTLFDSPDPKMIPISEMGLSLEMEIENAEDENAEVENAGDIEGTADTENVGNTENVSDREGTENETPIAKAATEEAVAEEAAAPVAEEAAAEDGGATMDEVVTQHAPVAPVVEGTYPSEAGDASQAGELEEAITVEADERRNGPDAREWSKIAREATTLPQEWWLTVERMSLDPALRAAVETLTP